MSLWCSAVGNILTINNQQKKINEKKKGIDQQLAKVWTAWLGLILTAIQRMRMMSLVEKMGPREMFSAGPA